MLIALTVFAAWLGWELRGIRERRALLALIEQFTASDDADAAGRPVYLVSYASPVTPATIPCWRRWLGDQAEERILLPTNMDVDHAKTATAVFPEAQVVKRTVD